ncbi:DNA polymerase III, delta subunit [Leptospira weilii serovar Ranarum str. ICFT]|uniref:DNA polymerase III, delta subunit n=1 Tax=Leptospira weilii serovar Ranarum str. ICFT TaxID=1218598 RepID=N1WN75_9LEPT|nr:DNA polymerase III subunit delta' [Leptospira weilii]EMY77258.1 DNA polymerase III, delta subunit [Leptospira weilii serovar Ranarum str. ICFT]
MNSFQLDDILGQDVALTFLKRYTSKPETIPPLLIFHGPDGTGKESASERFIKNVLCFEGTSCGICASCKAFVRHSHPDYIRFPEESGKIIPIGSEDNPDEFSIRWLIRSRLNYRPHLSRFRFIVFPDASLIGNEAETALLKSLEEAPHFSRFIFIVNNLDKLKETIISRAICVPFQYLNQNDLKRINTNFGLTTLPFQGGSLVSSDCPKEVMDLIQEKIKDRLETALDLLKLESWILSYKDEHPEWKENFSYKEFLELISLVLIYEYTRTDYENNLSKIETIFQFKAELHKKIIGIDTIALSRLFFQISL